MNNAKLKHIREELRNRRRLLSPEFQHQAASTITTTIINSEIFLQSETIGLYLPTEGEVATIPLIQAIWQHKKYCYLPHLRSTQEKLFEFQEYEPEDILLPNKYGIPEPIFNAQKIIAAKNIDLAIAPLVGFNNDGYRLGRGAGFYDRLFAYKIIYPKQKPFLMGIAYEFQRIEFEPNIWDVPMQRVITEKADS